MCTYPCTSILTGAALETPMQPIVCKRSLELKADWSLVACQHCACHASAAHGDMLAHEPFVWTKRWRSAQSKSRRASPDTRAACTRSNQWAQQGSSLLGASLGGGRRRTSADRQPRAPRQRRALQHSHTKGLRLAPTRYREPRLDLEGSKAPPRARWAVGNSLSQMPCDRRRCPSCSSGSSHPTTQPTRTRIRRRCSQSRLSLSAKGGGDSTLSLVRDWSRCHVQRYGCVQEAEGMTYQEKQEGEHEREDNRPRKVRVVYHRRDQLRAARPQD